VRRFDSLAAASDAYGLSREAWSAGGRCNFRFGRSRCPSRPSREIDDALDAESSANAEITALVTELSISH